MIPDEPTCIFSGDTAGPDGRGMYRYTLWRRDLKDRNWFPVKCEHGFDACPQCDAKASFSGRAKEYVQFICLNPSHATEEQGDLTVGRCIKWAFNWGFGAMVMTNLFAFRSPYPEAMKAAADPVGPDNDYNLLRLSKRAGMVVVGWGRDGAHRDRARLVHHMLTKAGVENLRCLSLTKDGFPTHPLARGKHRLPDNLTPLYFT